MVCWPRVEYAPAHGKWHMQITAAHMRAHAFCDDCGRRVPVSKAYSCADCEVDLCNDCFSKVSRMHLCVLHDCMPHNQLVQSGPSEDETPTAPPVREGYGQTKPRSGHGLTPGSHVSTRQTSPTPPALRVPYVKSCACSAAAWQRHWRRCPT